MKKSSKSASKTASKASSRPLFKSSSRPVSRTIALAGVLLTAAALSVGLAGCGSSGGGPVYNTGSLPAGSDGRVVPVQTNLSTLKVTISADKATYTSGTPISLTISVTNTSNAPSTISFPTASQATWWGYIIAQNGKIVTYEYSTSHNIAFPDVIGTDTFAPGATHTFTYAFPFTPAPGSPPLVTTLPAGTYQVYARLPDLVYDNGTAVRNTVPTPVSDPITITVTPAAGS